MIPEAVKEGEAVMVRDIPIMINATKINAHFGTSDYPQFKKMYRCRHNTKSSLAMELRRADDGVWEHGHMLKQSKLPQELIFWNLFNTFSLLPTTHRTTVSEPRADLLSCIQDQTKIDIGQVIMNAILEAASINMHSQAKLRKESQKLPHMGDLNKRSWQDVTIKTKGKKRLRITEGPSSTPGEEEPDFEFGESEEEDQNYEGDASQSMLAKILSAVEGIQLEDQATQRAAAEAERVRAEEAAAWQDRGKRHI
ncbi:hypothetical protein Ddye_019531 [Dipteronia dyeriana]|uniref:Putative plant transposon protein domain-containing protein n=1 Tax=Dipteronia dyeriana TaxID=168575 RepID=A0AAD9TY52_9ROSI|nr:hypothetical protein Ddye_019531 [Dipteronia dyeriana]